MTLSRIFSKIQLHKIAHNIVVIFTQKYVINYVQLTHKKKLHSNEKPLEH